MRVVENCSSRMVVVVLVVVLKMLMVEVKVVAINHCCFRCFFSGHLGYENINTWWCLFISSMVMTFLPTLSSLSSERTIGFSVSNVETSSKASSIGFCLLMIFLAIGSNFCLKLALLIMSLVM